MITSFNFCSVTCSIDKCCACQPQKFALDKLIIVSAYFGANSSVQVEKKKKIPDFETQSSTWLAV